MDNGDPKIEEHMAMQVAAMVQAFAPHLSQEDAFKVALMSVQTQSQLGQVLEDAVDPAKRATHPLWGVKVISIDGRGGEGVIKAPKDAAEALRRDAGKPPATLLHHTTILTMSSNPLSRALLLAYGFRTEFFQAKRESVIHRV